MRSSVKENDSHDSRTGQSGPDGSLCPVAGVGRGRHALQMYLMVHLEACTPAVPDLRMHDRS